MHASFPPYTRKAESAPVVPAAPVADLPQATIDELMADGWYERDASGI
jgi:hypothetical protein